MHRRDSVDSNGNVSRHSVRGTSERKDTSERGILTYTLSHTFRRGTFIKPESISLLCHPSLCHSIPEKVEMVHNFVLFFFSQSSNEP